MKVRITFPNRAPETWDIEENRWGGSPDLICSSMWNDCKCRVTFDNEEQRKFFRSNMKSYATATINGESYQVVVKAFGEKK